MIGLGIDAVEVPRFRRTLERTPGMRNRLFTLAELEYVAARADDAPSLAARFAAREAVMKALGVGLGAFAFHDVSVAVEPSGQPRLLVSGRATALSDAAGVTTWHLSITHVDLVAVAVAVAV